MSEEIKILEFEEFTKRAQKFLTNEEHHKLIEYLANHPEKGVLIPGTGGIRKMRWASQNKGKRGGSRVIYFYQRSDATILLLIYTDPVSRIGWLVR